MVPTKKGQRNTASLHLNFLADCQHFAQLAAVFGLLFVFPISRTLASVCFVCLVVSFWLFFFQLSSFNSSAAQEHKCAPRQGWQHKSQNARRAKHKIPPPRSCSSPCRFYLDFLLFFPTVLFLQLFLNLEGVELVSVCSITPPCARCSGWIPKTCNYAQFRPSN